MWGRCDQCSDTRQCILLQLLSTALVDETVIKLIRWSRCYNVVDDNDLKVKTQICKEYG